MNIKAGSHGQAPRTVSRCRIMMLVIESGERSECQLSREVKGDKNLKFLRRKQGLGSRLNGSAVAAPA
jgi:hypothetical protein